MRVLAGNLGEAVVSAGITIMGIAVAWQGSELPVGQINRMGPGFVPVFLGGLLAAIGIGLFVKAIRSDGDLQALPLRPFITVTAGMLAWTLLAPRFGLVPGTVALVIISSLAETGSRPLPLIIGSVALSAVGYVFFVWGLGVPLSGIRV